MRAFVLPDEDAWVLPEFWRREAYPRRGGCAGATRVIPPDPVGELSAWLRSDRVATDLARVTVDREVVFDAALEAEGRRYLLDWQAEPDARGAAVATLFLRQRLTGAEHAVDGWVARFGLEHAARVVGELSVLVATGSLWSVAPTPAKTYERLWRGEDLKGLYLVARVLRPYLAAAPDADYARICELLAGYRTSPVGRIVTSFLLPTQVAWVDEDCAAAAEWSADPPGAEEMCWGDARHLSAILLLAASSMRHLEQLHGHLTASLLTYQSPADVGTILDGVGPQAVPLLIEPFYRELLRLHDPDANYSYHKRVGPEGIRLLAATPTDEAFRLLCRATLGEPRTRPGALLKSGVLTRYPVRALRILTELAAANPVSTTDSRGRIEVSNPHEPAVYNDLLGTQILADPPACSRQRPGSCHRRCWPGPRKSWRPAAQQSAQAGSACSTPPPTAACWKAQTTKNERSPPWPQCRPTKPSDTWSTESNARTTGPPC